LNSLEIGTAFDPFEYREAAALIRVLLALVTVVNVFGSAQRKTLLHES
jgi:hypothetical protein